MYAVVEGLTMPLPTTDHGWIYEALQSLRNDMTQQHTRLREDVNRGFDAMRVTMEAQNDRMNDHSERLVVIETERRGEAALAVKRGTWAGILASAGLTGAIAAVKWLASK